jgi:hypothetical protein
VEESSYREKVSVKLFTRHGLVFSLAVGTKDARTGRPDRGSATKLFSGKLPPLLIGGRGIRLMQGGSGGGPQAFFAPRRSCDAARFFRKHAAA